MSGLMELVILVPCCFFIVALIKFLYHYLWIPLRIQHILNSQGIEGPPFRFIHGNNKEIAKMKQEALGKPVCKSPFLPGPIPTNNPKLGSPKSKHK
ncbi:hypothetical protein V6Z11_A02G030200 [Gossypium hirsutum]